MSRRASFIVICVLGLILAALQFAANEYSLYWHWWWFDILTHFVGGMIVGGGALWVAIHELHITSLKEKFAVVFAVTALIAIGWEVFEYVTGVYNALNYWADTSLDLVMDVLGMLLAFFALSSND